MGFLDSLFSLKLWNGGISILNGDLWGMHKDRFQYFSDLGS